MRWKKKIFFAFASRSGGRGRGRGAARCGGGRGLGWQRDEEDETKIEGTKKRLRRKTNEWRKNRTSVFFCWEKSEGEK